MNCTTCQQPLSDQDTITLSLSVLCRETEVTRQEVISASVHRRHACADWMHQLAEHLKVAVATAGKQKTP